MHAYTDDDFTVIEVPTYLNRWAMDSIADEYESKVNNMEHDYVLDFKDVKHVYSTTARLIIHLYKTVTAFHSRLSIANASQSVENALRALRFTERIPVYRTILDFEFERENTVEVMA